VNCVVKDTVIYERLEGDQPLKDDTLAHLEDFANIGWQLIVYISSQFALKEVLIDLTASANAVMLFA